MEKNIVMEQPKTGVAGRFVGLLAGAVALLAVAFIVLIACGTWALQQQQTVCDNVTNLQEEHAVQRDINVKHNNTVTHERITAYPESKLEFIVNRNAETGHVETVVTVDYQQKKTTLYTAADNTCYIAKNHVQDFDNALNALEEVPDENNAEEKVGKNFVIGEKVQNASEIPMQMTPFCSPHNTHLLEEYDSEHGGRNKRQVYACIYYCWYVYYPWVTVNGRTSYLYYCLFYLDLSQDCQSPDTNVNYQGYAYIYPDGTWNLPPGK